MIFFRFLLFIYFLEFYFFLDFYFLFFLDFFSNCALGLIEKLNDIYLDFHDLNFVDQLAQQEGVSEHPDARGPQPSGHFLFQRHHRFGAEPSGDDVDDHDQVAQAEDDPRQDHQSVEPGPRTDIRRSCRVKHLNLIELPLTTINWRHRPATKSPNPMVVKLINA